MKKLFGTDGIRGKAYHYPLDKRTVYYLGRVVGKNLKKNSNFLIGMDTRESSPNLSSYIFSGLKSIDIEPIFLGVISTPALSWITKALKKTEISVMVSASHNPYEDNGLKFFSDDGTKIADKNEELIEMMLEQENEEIVSFSLPEPNEKLKEMYRDWLISLFSKNFLKGIKVVIDTANGSLSGFAQEIFKYFGAEVIPLGDSPDGKNINKNVGTLYPDLAIEKLNENSCNIAICFDGDGDRVLFALPPNLILDGDDLLYLFALYFKDKGLLKNGVVATSMSNMGLEVALKKENISLYRTNVGDRYVFEELRKKDLILGGEQSGHIILRNFSNTGDGLLVSLKTLEILKEKGFNLKLFKKFPQKIINYSVEEKFPFEEIKSYKNFLKDIKKIIGNGRIVIRYSGTETLLRVMLEAEDEEKISIAENKINEFVKNHWHLK